MYMYVYVYVCIYIYIYIYIHILSTHNHNLSNVICDFSRFSITRFHAGDSMVLDGGNKPFHFTPLAISFQTNSSFFFFCFSRSCSRWACTAPPPRTASGAAAAPTTSRSCGPAAARWTEALLMHVLYMLYEETHVFLCMCMV